MFANIHRFGVNPGFHEVARRNTILSARIRVPYEAHYTTNLTIKWVISGCAKYRTRHCDYAVDPSCFPLLNHGQTYDLQILPNNGTETLALFFEPRFVGETMRTAATHERTLLDEPFITHVVDVPFFERLYPLRGAISDVLRRVKSLLPTDRTGASWIEDAFYDLTAVLPSTNGQAMSEWSRLPAKRGATRREVYRRLVYARDYAYSCYQEDLNVERLARIACMSPFHFHRMFGHAFGLTPNAFVQRRRLTVARRMLESTERNVAQVCRAVGFRSLGTFSTLYLSHFGVTPGQVRVAE